MPALLAQRFDQLLSEFQLGLIKLEGEQVTWAQVVDGYVEEMRATLLSEAETRLLPTLGLIETINEDTHYKCL